MMPMNGFSGISISSENNATRRSRSIRINFADCSVSSFSTFYPWTRVIYSVENAKLDVEHANFKRIPRRLPRRRSGQLEYVHCPLGPFDLIVHGTASGSTSSEPYSVAVEEFHQALVGVSP